MRKAIKRMAKIAGDVYDNELGNFMAKGSNVYCQRCGEKLEEMITHYCPVVRIIEAKDLK